MSSRLTRVLAWRWTPWLFNVAVALAMRALLPVDLSSRGERYTYYGMSRVFPLSTCASFHCFRFLPPLFTALVPGEIADAFIVTSVVFQVLAGVALWHLAERLSGTRRVAWLTTAWYWVTWAPIQSLSDPLLITDPVQAFWCFSSLYLLLTGRHGLALAMLVSGAAVKESVLLVPLIYAAYVVVTTPRASWRLARMTALVVAPAAAWLGVRAVLHTYHGYAIAGDSSYLRQTYFFGVWLKGLAPWPLNLRFAALYIFGTFGAGWVLGALGLTRANRHERAIAVAAAPAMLFLALYQVPDRALASFPYAVLIPAARYVSAWPTPLTAVLLIVNAALTIRMNTAPGWLPSSAIVLAALAAVVALGIWTTRRTPVPAAALDDDGSTDERGGGDIMRLSLAALGIAAGLVVVFLWQSAHIPPVARLSLPDGLAVVDDDAGTPGLALSPDERVLVFVGGDRSGAHRLWRLRLGETVAIALDGTDGASAPFWAPDGRRLGFFADGKLKTADVDSARTNVVVVADAPAPRGGAWGARDVIVFAPSEHEGLYRVSALGGTPVAITALDTASGQRSHRWPSFVPDHERFFFAAWEAAGTSAVYLGSLLSAPPMRLGEGVNHPMYAGGFLVHPRATSLFAQAFDRRRQQLLGSPRVARDPSAYSPEVGRGAFTVGEHTLVYASTTAQWQLAPATAVGEWLDLAGRPAPIQGEAPAIGRRVRAGTPAAEIESEVSPDGRWVAYTSLVSGEPRIFVRPNPPNGPAWPVSDEGGLHPHWRADGRELFFVIGDRFLAAAAVDTSSGFHSGAPRRLFAVDFPPGDSTHAASDFVVAADGRSVFVRVLLGQHASAPVFIVRQWRSRLASP